MPPRFYVPEAHHEESVIALPDDEAVHLTRVLRLTGGAPVRIFNGRGEEWDARVVDAGKRRVTAQLLRRVAAAAEPEVRITLAIAVLKADKMDDVVRDAVMLGVEAIIPMLTARSEASAAAIARGRRVDRWRRIAVSSAKQCGRAVVPDVRSPEPFDAVAASAPRTIMLVEPEAGVGSETLAVLGRGTAADRRAPITLLVGPEGGWTAQEVQRARDSGAMLLTLGRLTLRADAVPLVALTALRVRLEDL